MPSALYEDPDIEKDPIFQAKKLIDVIRYFKKVQYVGLPKGVPCPLNKNDSELDHYQLSQAAAGLGMIRWDCPFCGEHFEE